MVMKPGPVYRALRSIERVNGRSLVILLTPQGRTFDQPAAWDLSYYVGSSTNLITAPCTNATEAAGVGALETGFESATNRIPIGSEPVQFMQLNISID